IEAEGFTLYSSGDSQSQILAPLSISHDGYEDDEAEDTYMLPLPLQNSEVSMELLPTGIEAKGFTLYSSGNSQSQILAPLSISHDGYEDDEGKTYLTPILLRSDTINGSENSLNMSNNSGVTIITIEDTYIPLSPSQNSESQILMPLSISHDGYEDDEGRTYLTPILSRSDAMDVPMSPTISSIYAHSEHSERIPFLIKMIDLLLMIICYTSSIIDAWQNRIGTIWRIPPISLSGYCKFACLTH
ncbi:17113_t:CDS:2, partial [Acaulospora morrowiae]